MVFEKVTIYEVLKRVATANKMNETCVNLVTDYIPCEDKKWTIDNKFRDSHKETNKLR